MIATSLISLCLAAATIALPTPNTFLAPLRRAVDIPGAVAPIPDAYIVALKENTVDPHARGDWLNVVLSSRGHVRRDLTELDFRLGWNETVFNGLAGRFSDSEIRTLQQQGEVSYIQHDTLLHTTALVVQLNAVWGLSRISSGATPLPPNSDPASFGFQYTFDDSGGSGVDIFVLDTGIRATHQDFGGR
ncbi:subtilisin-like serine protease, partial [Serendipita sp. 400]